jgi:hypothetical protein
LTTKSRLALRLALFHLTLFSVCSAQAVPRAGQVLASVQENVKQFAASLPNFVCDETIVSRELAAGRVRHETVIESVFIGTQKNDAKGRPFTESREIKTIDGHDAARGQQPRGSFFVGGGFSSILVALFAQNNIEHYKVIGAEKLEGRDTLVIKFTTRTDQVVLLDQDIFGTNFMSKGTGKAWIDRESMHVVRLELQFLNPPVFDSTLSESIDYAPVVINGKTFWMPKRLSAELTQKSAKAPLVGQYIAEYSNYHKFEVSVRMNFGSQN